MNSSSQSTGSRDVPNRKGPRPTPQAVASTEERIWSVSAGHKPRCSSPPWQILYETNAEEEAFLRTTIGVRSANVRQWWKRNATYD